MVALYSAPHNAAANILYNMKVSFKVYGKGNNADTRQEVPRRKYSM